MSGLFLEVISIMCCWGCHSHQWCLWDWYSRNEWFVPSTHKQYALNNIIIQWIEERWLRQWWQSIEWLNGICILFPSLFFTPHSFVLSLVFYHFETSPASSVLPFPPIELFSSWFLGGSIQSLCSQSVKDTVENVLLLVNNHVCYNCCHPVS